MVYDDDNCSCVENGTILINFAAGYFYGYVGIESVINVLGGLETGL